MPALPDGNILVRTLYLSLDPYMRGRMSDAQSYASPVAIGAPMEGEAIAEIAESRHPDYRPGELIRAMIGWRTHAVIDPATARRINVGRAPITTALGVLGMPGFAAYSGLKVIGQPKPGETVAVAAATGPVGSLVGQLAKRVGARTVGIAGGPEKRRSLTTEFGFDRAVDHKSKSFAKALSEACPDGIDVYFENVGGAVWQAVLPLLNRYARVPVCGLVAHYDGGADVGRDLLPDTMLAVLRRSLLLRGFINSEFILEYYDAFLSELTPLVATGAIRYREDIVEGLEAA